MHYKNGRAAKNGDPVLMISPGEFLPISGVLVNAKAGNDFCNGQIVRDGAPSHYANLKECLHIDDIAKAIIPDSTKLLELNDFVTTPDSPAQ